ncbi:MAG TPA: glycosyltransferase family 2 protein [Cyclobacteriaceae bacterium]|nr:glycosyltransferase family 2 protein [Cytophagales bacterium]HNT49074.1 glycosyltransferase family 2 protein [Cyclobacteriaceae bacterium]HRE66754.1 glycosyltransferase family 2 protein [Cyclobacteriaceae bacterium]HRF33568.1 glycosyltransferase family 2 protein [Cyclobacteriaceae bacterium]
MGRFFGKNNPPVTPPDSELPEITLLVAAYNEESYIVQKIENSLSLDYPASKLHLWIVADGSTDRTVEFCQKYPTVTVFYSPGRKGKIHAVNRVMQEVKTPVVIFSDANTDLNTNALKNIVRHFTDPNVGGVAGEKRIVSLTQDNASGSGEGLYWKYESALKMLDSKFTTAIGAAGELFAVRTELYINPHTDTIIEDFVTSMKIVAAGYRFAYEPDAYAIETASASIKDEWKRKVRISAGGIQAIMRLPELLNVFKYGWVSWQYVSHRAMRWSVAPLALATLLVTNIILLPQSVFYTLTLIAQSAFYILAVVGHLVREKKITIKGFFIPYYFTMMNVSVFAGALRLLRRKQSVVWEKSARAEK